MRPRRPLFRPGAACAALALGCASMPFQGETGIRPFAFDLWDVHCPSGLRVIFERAPGSAVAGVTTVVGAGSRQDPPGREGLAHLVEHLAFRAHGPDQSPMKVRLWEMGASYNADTDFEATTYHAVVPRDNLRQLLAAASENLLDPLAGVDEATFAVERDVVRNERRENHETRTMSEAFDAAQRAVFQPDHPYHRPIIGTHATLSALTLDDARRYVAANYRPQAMTMVVVGDLGLDTVEAFVRGALPPALYGDPRRPRPVWTPPAVPGGAPPLPATGALPRSQASVPSPEIWIAWSLPGGPTPELHMAEMWAWMSNGTFYWGRLDDNDVGDVDFWAVQEQLASTFVCRVSLSEGKHPEESLRQVLDALPWIAGDGFYLEKRFDGIKLAMLRELALDSEGVVQRSRLRADHAHFMGGTNAYSARIDALKAIDADRATDFARRYLGKDRARAVLLLPLGDDARPPTPIPAAHDLATAVRRTPLPAATLRQLSALRPLEGMRTVTLGNGLQVIAIRRPSAPVLTATLAFHGGQSADRAAVAAAAAEAVKLNFEEGPGDFGIHLHFRAVRDLAELGVQGGPAHLERALDMLSFAVRSYDVEWPSDKFRETKLPLRRRHDGSPHNRGQRAFLAGLFPGHPEDEYVTADQIAAVAKRDVTAWLDRTVAPGNAALVIVGDVDLARAEAAARSSLGGWGWSSKPAGPPPQVAPAGPGRAGRLFQDGAGVVLTHRPGATQAEIDLGCLLPPADARADAVYDVAADLVDGELSDQLRERIGSTYGVHVWAGTLRGGTAFLRLQANVDNGRLPLVLGLVADFWDGVTRQGVDAKWVQRSRELLATHRLMRYQSSLAVADAVVTYWNNGWPLAAVDEVPATFASVAPREVDAALRACARGMVVSITGDQGVARAALKPPPPPQPAP